MAETGTKYESKITVWKLAINEGCLKSKRLGQNEGEERGLKENRKGGDQLAIFTDVSTFRWDKFQVLCG